MTRLDLRQLDGSSARPLPSGLNSRTSRALAIAPGSPGTVYLGTFGGGVYKTTDRGGLWVSNSNGLANLVVYALAIDPLTPSTLYAGTVGGVFQSPDGGDHCVPAGSGITTSEIYALAIDPLNPAGATRIFPRGHRRSLSTT